MKGLMKFMSTFQGSLGMKGLIKFMSTFQGSLGMKGLIKFMSTFQGISRHERVNEIHVNFPGDLEA